MNRPIVFLTDYGLTDGFVGICHGVIARIAPEARGIDLTHQVARQDVVGGGAAPRVLLPPVSRPFPGRDVFAPAAAHLSAGLALEDLGPAVSTGNLQVLHLPSPMVTPGSVGAGGVA